MSRFQGLIALVDEFGSEASAESEHADRQMRTYIVAGNRQQADAWIRKHSRLITENPNFLGHFDVHLASSWNTLRGIHGPCRIVAVGTWRTLRDAEQIEEQLTFLARVDPSIVVEEWHDERIRHRPPVQMFQATSAGKTARPHMRGLTPHSVLLDEMTEWNLDKGRRSDVYPRHGSE